MSPVEHTELPTTARECTSEGEALSLVARIERGECTSCSTQTYEACVLDAAQRHWWAAARGFVNLLRSANVAVSSETRFALTQLRDESASVLSLLRQTRMDEATIRCAVLWAQGTTGVHLSVKFASRLDAPVTVLNVDNEQVTINETHVLFSGIGRQKPKRYVVEIELFEPIQPALSSWAFGSVGTVRFTLRKGNATEWKRLTLAAEGLPFKHRVWWEKQEQVEEEEKKLREEEAARKKKLREDEAAARREEAAREKARVEAEARRLEDEERAALRAKGLPLVEAAMAAMEALVAGPAEEAFEATRTATAGLLEAVGQASNQTAREYAESLLNSARSLSSTGFADLTKDALQSTVAQYAAFCQGLVPPAVEAEAGGAAGTAAPKKKRAKKRKKASAPAAST